ncbi:MAG: WbqC family protein [Gammaproteobacteria bacterium]|jgi:hypothetical protein|nr:WbqC family protein [Gammaproteobacteria bacterium]MBU2181064.1 WbqC family protein [Gammaproteobacteria bacterium]MBU2225794.1 WbqC family protein [Gammaproteobacteria bacterium]
MKVVISQSMFFPWRGMLEQLKLADVFVHYDDVPFSKGSFTNRVQLKTAHGPKWLTLPLSDLHLGQHIEQVQVTAKSIWLNRHLALLEQSLSKAGYYQDALELYSSVTESSTVSLADISRKSMLALSDYFKLSQTVEFIDSRSLRIGGSGSTRVLDIVKALGGTSYITGQGARQYLQHHEFADAGIDVQYMNYCCTPYPQLDGPFTPYVSALDLVANCGPDAAQWLQPQTVSWQEFLGESDE